MKSRGPAVEGLRAGPKLPATGGRTPARGASRFPAPIIASEIVFRAELDSALPIHLDLEEHDAWGWFTFAEAYEKIRWSDDREAIERVEATTANAQLATNS